MDVFRTVSTKTRHDKKLSHFIGTCYAALELKTTAPPTFKNIFSSWGFKQNGVPTIRPHLFCLGVLSQVTACSGLTITYILAASSLNRMRSVPYLK